MLLSCLTIASTLLHATTQVSAFSVLPYTKLNRRYGVELATNPRSKQSHLHMMDASFITEAYSTSLEQHPFVTKGTTGSFLCGVADVIAQVRTIDACRPFEDEDETSQQPLEFDISLLEEIDSTRLARFALKGFFGTSLLSAWYDLADHLFDSNNVEFILQTVGITEASDLVRNVARTGMLMLTEQFVTCPILYGLWEIPVSTLLNGAPPSRIQYEVKDKLGDMLIENAKVWTLVNIIIYNAPLQYRTGMANIMDIIWQSIVSDFAADCGTPEGVEEDVDAGFEEGLVVAMQDESLEHVGNKAMMNGSDEKLKINTAKDVVERQRVLVR